MSEELEEKEVNVYVQSIDELVPDENNVNQHTKKGLKLLDKSMEENGIGRSILSAGDDVVIAGNATLKTAKKRGVKKVVTVEIDGSDTIVNVKRKDLTGDSEKAKNLALADNRVGEVNLMWDYGKMGELFESETLEAYSFKSNLFEFDGEEKKVEVKKPETGTKTIFITFPEQTYKEVMIKLEESGEDIATVLLYALGLLK